MMPGASGPTFLYRLYRGATALLLPFAYRKVAGKLRDHGVDEARIRERQGHASAARPDGPLIWFHAASVGESLSVLSLIKRLGERLPDTHFLITSGTATSAELVAQRMPPRTRHQYAPLDAAAPVARFLDHWQPTAGLFVESEIWPLMLVEAHSRGVKLALLNARLSKKSVEGWKKWPGTARYVLDQFDLMISQNRRIANDLREMGADPDRVFAGSNLKASASPPPVKPEVLSAVRAQLGNRPVWIASSTHAGEEEVVLDAHRRLLERVPDLCMILAPRHPERGDEVATLLAGSGLTHTRRATGGGIATDTQVYLADTLGEVGTWYALAPIAFLGATLVPKGGHNPFEPALAGVAVAAGPHVENAADAYAGLIAAHGLVRITDAESLTAQVAEWLSDDDALARTRKAAQSYAESQNQALDEVVDRLCDALELDHA